MTGLPSILYLLICLSWQTSSSLSEKAFQDHLPPPIFSLDDLIHISLHREKRAASIRIPSSPIIMSAGRILQIPCDTSISGSTIAWAKDTLNNIVSNRKSLFTISATTAWSGTYFCIVSQRSLSTFASVTVDIVPLPRKEVISVYTPTPVITSCGTQAQIFCCVTDPDFSNYRITFSGDNSPTHSQAGGLYKSGPRYLLLVLETSRSFWKLVGGGNEAMICIWLGQPINIAEPDQQGQLLGGQWSTETVM
ncbi:uncharacterized protein LOC120935619 [Rana temporaria]|uniref:uncharacterized protein LOC120935619 n=1 Tax=Rana temporaria TaxID=8407 RepID=UPI001AACEB75|nr:uncharacterized protein LOC120935619 [Rana temporaria]